MIGLCGQSCRHGNRGAVAGASSLWDTVAVGFESVCY